MSGWQRERMAELYASGQSIPQIADQTGANRSRVRSELIAMGVKLRTRTEALRLRDGLGTALKGRTRTFSEEWKKNIASGRQKWGAENAAGKSHKASGYVEITRGPYKGRSEHVQVMEKRLGRRLLADEVVHHIDRDRSNNHPDNLALVTRSGHSRLHRFEDKLEGKERNRINGRLS